MKSLHPFLLAAFAFSGWAFAQEATLPEHTYFGPTGASTTVWRGTAFRNQQVFDTTNLTDQGVNGVILITRLRFRAADGATDPGGTQYGTVNVQMSSCPANYSSISTTFLSNRGSNNQLCYSGGVTTLPANGGAPNDYFIDIVLANPFAYDPTLGQDLVVEIDATGPNGAVPTAAATSSRSRRISVGNTTAATGTATSACGVILLDFVGPGGWSTWSSATTTSSGSGCYAVASSFYELFPDTSAFDLSNTTLTLTPNGSGGYDVGFGGPTTFFPHGLLHLGLTDDDVSVQNVPAGFGAGFGYPTGATSPTLTICDNGYIGLNTLIPFADLPIDETSLLISFTAMLAPFFVDVSPTPANNVYYDVDPSGTTVYVTWDNVPTFTAGGTVDLQVALHASGIVEYRYGSCVGPSGDVGIVGWSPGFGAVDPGNTDLSTVPSFSTSGPDVPPLTLFSPRAFVNTTILETVSYIPANAAFTIRILAAAPLPGIDLGIVGAPDCPLWVDVNAIVDMGLSVATPDADFTFSIPNDLSLFGVTAYTQGLSFVATANPFGVMTTNGSAMTIGNS